MYKVRVRVAIFQIIGHLIFGWPAYLFRNDTGGRVQADLKSRMDKRQYKDHFHHKSQVMKSSLGWKIELSTAGCVSVLYVLIKYLGKSSLYWYFGPYIVMNAWLVLYTWLHHTHPDVPHYGEDNYSFLQGALSTIDRPYPELINHLHHNIGSTHVAHHLNYRIPHYRAVACTEELKCVLGKYYNYDPSSITSALYNVAKTCHYVEEVSGVQKYKKL